MARAIGRPSKYTQALADQICEELSNGKSLRSVCKDAKLPDARTVFRWLRTNEQFCQQYARAKQESADAMAEEIQDISDRALEDAYAGSDNKAVNAVVNAHRMRIDTRKWLMAKMKPKKYGDKQEVDVTSQGEKIVFMPPELLTKNDISNPDASAG